MFEKFFSKTGIKSLIDKVRIGGLSVLSHLKTNRDNTKKSFKDLFKHSVMGEAPLEQAIDSVSKLAKTRKRQTLTTLKNVASAVRGRARAIAAAGRKGKWYNNGTLDGKTTQICKRYMGASWDLPYSEIPDKPPRVSITPHPCRSFLRFVPTGDPAPDERPFMEQFNESEEAQRELLGPVRFAAFAAGVLVINSFADYEKTVLTTIEELDIE